MLETKHSFGDNINVASWNTRFDDMRLVDVAGHKT
jgi:hypothetical protein